MASCNDNKFNIDFNYISLKRPFKLSFVYHWVKSALNKIFSLLAFRDQYV